MVIASPFLVCFCAAIYVYFVSGGGSYASSYDSLRYVESARIYNRFEQHDFVLSDYLYLIQDSRSGDIKIGRSKDPYKRLKQLQTGSSSKLNLIGVYPNCGWREKSLHMMLESFRLEGEWFREEALNYFPHEQLSFRR